MSEDGFYSECHFDESGKIALPSFWLDRIGFSGGVVLIPRALSTELGYFATDIWPNDTRFEAHVQSLDRLLNKKSLASRRQKRLVLAGIFYKQLESGGLLHVNQHHRDISRLGISAICVDMTDHLELWNAEVWHKRCQDMQDLISSAG